MTGPRICYMLGILYNQLTLLMHYILILVSVCVVTAQMLTVS